MGAHKWFISLSRCLFLTQEERYKVEALQANIGEPNEKSKQKKDKNLSLIRFQTQLQAIGASSSSKIELPNQRAKKQIDTAGYKSLARSLSQVLFGMLSRRWFLELRLHDRATWTNERAQGFVFTCEFRVSG